MSESLDDLIKKRMEKKITKATYNPNDVPLDFKNNEPQYFLEFYNKETIKIHYHGMFETEPPILRFRNDYDNSTVPYEWIEDERFVELIQKQKLFFINYQIIKIVMIQCIRWYSHIIKIKLFLDMVRYL